MVNQIGKPNFNNPMINSNSIAFKIKTVLILLSLLFINCSTNNTENPEDNNIIITDDENSNEEEEDDDQSQSYANINFTNWKVTLPVDEDNNGKPDEYQPDELVNLGYQTLDAVQPYMYDDLDDESLIFYCFQGGATTTNSSYPRTELRELINPSNSRDNWTLEEGGQMSGRLKIQAISENNNSSDDFHKVIVMQIHGIISEQDMDTYGFDGNNGPPLIKIYWKDGYIWCHKKSLVDESTEGDDLYDVYNGTWADIKVNLGYVGYEIFDFKITASDAKIEVQLNDNQIYTYEDISLEKWPFENYFKAGNYLTTTDADAYCYLKYFELTITH